MRSKGFGVNLKQRLGWGSNHGTRYSQTDGLTITLLMYTNQSQIIETIFFWDFYIFTVPYNLQDLETIFGKMRVSKTLPFLTLH